MRKHIRIGSEFDLKVEEIERLENARTRSFLAKLVAALVSVFLTGAASVGAYHGAFHELRDLWIAIGPLSTLLLGYYFGSHSASRKEVDS
jgi:hypothetical protein